MLVEAFIRPGDQLPVEALFVDTCFVSRRQQNSLLLRIESEGDTPHTIICIASQFFHVRVFGTFQSIRIRPLQTRADHCQQFDPDEDRILHRFGKAIELPVECVMKLNFAFNTPL